MGEMSHAQPPVTWLMPVKNGMPYLPETLASIANQTYRNHALLVRDDGSTDGTLDELRRWVPARIPGEIFSGEPLGIGRSLAFLVERATTELCARIDGDDVNLPDRLARQVEFLLDHPEIGVVGSHVRVIDEAGREGELWAFETSDAEIRWLTRYACRLCHPTVMFRRGIVLAAGNYPDFIFQRDSMYEDWELWRRLARTTEMYNLPEVLVHYRRFSGSVTGHVQDWAPVLRSVATANAPNLFPGVPDPAAALELWESSLPSKFTRAGSAVAAKPWHLRQLRNSARLLAAQCHKPDNYFTETESFRDQYYSMKRRLLRRFGLGPLLKARDYFAAIEA
jgi:glycosyltransferase involved in cell wall biosynthesis